MGAFFLQGLKLSSFTSQFHTSFISSFIHQFHTPVSYPSFIPQFHTLVSYQFHAPVSYKLVYISIYIYMYKIC